MPDIESTAEFDTLTSQAPMQPSANEALPATSEDVVRRLVGNLESVVHGKTDEIRLVLAALVCGGHVLLEDVPGTWRRRCLARAIALG